MTAVIRQIDRAGAALAYQVTGGGPSDLLVVHDFAGHLELDWQLPGAARLFERLASFARVVRFDKRGTGLSSRAAAVAGAETDAADALAVLDDAAVDACIVFAWGDGVAAGVLLAARHPGRVSGLVLYGGSARPPPRGAGAMTAADRVASAWGDRIPPGFAGSTGADDELMEWWRVRARAAATPRAAFELVLTAAQSDVRADAPHVVVPTVVLHRGGDRAVLPAEGRALADLIPTSRFVELEGDAHLPYIDPDQLADEVESFVTGPRSRERAAWLGVYELERELGRGGMGTVHVALDRRLDRRIALKVLPPELAGDDDYRRRFLREQRLAASLEHPAIVPIYDAGEAGGRLYLAMRYVEGTDLRRLIEADGALDPQRIVRIVGQVAEALDAAHARGLVHRDVKPANILLDAQERAYLCDFGLTKEAAPAAAATAAGTLVGTLDYLAPEQIRGDEIDGRADVYSLGCVLYEGVTGRPPHGGRGEAQTLWGHMREEAVPPSDLRAGVPPALDDVVARALAKEPDDRFASAGGLAAAARSAVGIEAAAVGRSRGRARALVVAGGVLVAAAAAAAFALTRGDGAVSALPGTVAVLDAATGQRLAAIPVGREPTDVTYAHGTVWATSPDDDRLTQIAAGRRRVARTIHVGIAAGSVAVAGRWVWVGSFDDRRVLRIAPASGAVVGRLVLPRRDAEGDTVTYALAADGARLWAAAGNGGLVGVDTRRTRVAHVTAIREAVDVAVGEGSVWVLTTRSLARVAPTTGRVTGQVALPNALALAVGSGGVWVTQLGGGVQRVDPRTLALGPTIAVGPDGRAGGAGRGARVAAPVAVAAGTGAVWVASLDGTLARVDPATSRVVARVHLDGSPSSLAVGGGVLWVAVQELRRA